MVMPPLLAYHGENWESPQWAVAIRGERPTPPLQQWTIRAQAREHADATAPTFVWTVAGGGIVFDTAEVTLRSGDTLTTDTIQLLLAPADWADKPRNWSGVLEVEISSDDTATPAQRRTIVRARPFRVEGDTAR